jgi:ABC-type antimicrobial peptide transport system permease subunit
VRLVDDAVQDLRFAMALGASGGVVRRMILGESLILVAAGVAIGLPITLATTRLASAQLFGVTPTDPVTLTGATVLMIGVAAMAGFARASRASRVDPMVALRCE